MLSSKRKGTHRASYQTFLKRLIFHLESETTCTKDTKSVTESDFPNVFDDLTIFDEFDKQKLSKKQKKKLKKKN